MNSKRKPLSCGLVACLLTVHGSLLVPRPAAAQANAPGSAEPGPAPAEPTPSEEELNMARELGASGIELFESGAYPEASQQLEHAYKFVKVPTTGLWSARALERLGQLLAAERRYQEVLEMPEQPGEPAVFGDARKSAQHELDLLRPRIPKLVIQLKGATAGEVRVTLDDVEIEKQQLGVEFPVDPGERRVVGYRGQRVERVTLALPERASARAILDFSSVPSAPPASADVDGLASIDDQSDTRTWGYVALGVGGAALVTGVVASVVASGKRDDLKQNCPNESCAPQFHGDIDSLNNTLTLSLVGYLGAAVGAGVGTYLLLSADDGSEEAAASEGWSLWVGPASAGVNGRF